MEEIIKALEEATLGSEVRRSIVEALRLIEDRLTKLEGEGKADE